MAFEISTWILFVTVGMLVIIVFSLRLLVSMEKRIARIDMHIERMLQRVLKEDIRIERRIEGKNMAKRDR